MIQEQIVYLPIKENKGFTVVEEGRVNNYVDEQEVFVFTSEQLNEYITNIIKQTLESAAEKADTLPTDSMTGVQYFKNSAPSGYDAYESIDKDSILDLFEEIYNQFKV